jgi:hypothetical protein
MIMMSSRVFAVALPVLILAILSGCDQKVDKGDDKLTEGNQSMEVSYYDSTEMVHFDNLETLYLFNDQPVVSLEALVLGSGLVVSIDSLWINFVGTDGYSPLGSASCVAESSYVPTPSNMLDKGYIERGTRRLLWEDSLEAPQCMSVKDVEIVYVADNPEDLPVGGDTDADTDTDTGQGFITVDYEGDTEDVTLDGLETSDIDGTPVVLLPTIFDETEITFDLSSVVLSFEGSDGYNPVAEGTCEEALPASGDLAGQAGIDPLTNDILWDPALDFPGCAFLKDAAIVYVTDN